MIGTIIEHSLHTHYRIGSQRSFYHRVLNTLLHCREVVLGNCAAHYDLLKYIRLLQITGRLECHLNVTVLTMSAGLFLIFCFHIGFLRIVSRNGTLGLESSMSTL